MDQVFKTERGRNETSDKDGAFQAGWQHGQRVAPPGSFTFYHQPGIIIPSATFKCLLCVQHFWGPESSRDSSVPAFDGLSNSSQEMLDAQWAKLIDGD